MTNSKAIVLINSDRDQRYIPHYNPGYNLKSNNYANLSEYQAVYKKWQWQRPRKCIRPQVNKIQIAAPIKSDTTYRTDYAEPKVVAGQKKKIHKQKGINPQYKYLQDEAIKRNTAQRKTTYATDYCPKQIQKRMPFTSIGEQSYRPHKDAFNAKSMYQVSYQKYTPDIMRGCRPNLIIPQSLLHSNVDRSKEEILPDHESEAGDAVPDNPGKTPIKSNSKTDITESTGQNPSKSNSKSSNPGTKVTEQSPKQESNDEVVKCQGNVQETQGNIEVDPTLVTTFMADFKPNWNVKKRTPCKPVETNYRALVSPFDGTTTHSAEYKAWPVNKPEVPKWAQKPVYVVPTEGMAVNSTYTMDFVDPKVIKTVAAMKKPQVNENIINPKGDNTVFNPETTYTTNFKEWKSAEAAKSYHVKSVYNPPKEKMDCESTHRRYYKGQQGTKTKLLRQTSEHRQLNKGGKLTFDTTYRATYKDHRPKSCPGAIKRSALFGVHVKSAWGEDSAKLDLSSKKQLNQSHDSGIDILDCETHEETEEDTDVK